MLKYPGCRGKEIYYSNRNKRLIKESLFPAPVPDYASALRSAFHGGAYGSGILFDI